MSWSDIEEPVIAEPEGVCFIGELVLFGMSQKLVPDIEPVLFQFPDFLLAQI